MTRLQRFVRRALRPGAAAALLLLHQTPAAAQPWVPPAGIGSVTVSVQQIDNTGHRLTDGSKVDGSSISTSIYIDADYAVTDRLVIGGGIPYVATKWTNAGPPPPFIPFLPVDQCHCWHMGWQDVAVSARYNAINARGFALTPSVALGVPSHDYDFRGEAVIGRDLKEARLGVDVGQRLDAISPKLSVEGRYTYAFVERVLDVPNNRSNAAATGAYQFTRKFGVRGNVLWQHTHGGLRLGGGALVPPGDVDTPEKLFQHDRLLRDDNVRAGGGASYSLPSVDLFVSYLEYLSGSDTHLGRAFTAGVSWPFEIHRQPGPPPGR
jgi:hypothetical protein